VLCDCKVREYLLSQSEQCLSDLEFDTGDELSDCAFLVGAINDKTSAQDFIWENMHTYKGKMETVLRQCWTSRCYKICCQSCGHFEIVFQALNQVTCHGMETCDQWKCLLY
jgi:hypothetical protein